jgi:hypothetical protein
MAEVDLQDIKNRMALLEIGTAKFQSIHAPNLQNQAHSDTSSQPNTAPYVSSEETDRRNVFIRNVDPYVISEEL